MVGLLGIALALIPVLYVIHSVCLREFRIRLRWPAFAALGLLIGGALVLVLESELFRPLPVISLAYVYPGLTFVLVLGIAGLLGLLLRQRLQGFYKPLE